MTLTAHDRQLCRLVSITGDYLTPNGTFSPDPKDAYVAQRWWLDRQASMINTVTVIIRAA